MQGQRIFYTGHSFHVFIAPILQDIAAAAGISGQEYLGLSAIGGSRVIQHWGVPDATTVFKSIDEYCAAVNQKLGQMVLYIVPAGQAVIALREPIRTGKAGGLKTQTELFRDRVGHPALPLQVLVAYCHYAVFYRRSPAGLPTPEILANAQKPEWSDEKTVRVLQDVAWEAVTQHPQSGL